MSETTRPHGFLTTRWSLVAAAAGEGDALRRRAALEHLASSYWPPLYAFLRARGRTSADAADRVQELFTRLLEGDALARLGPEGGRFRNWLLTCLLNLERDLAAAARAERRGGGATAIPIDADAGERFYLELAGDGGLEPEAVFERAWARRVLEVARAELEREHVARGRAEVFQALAPLLDGGDPGDRGALAKRLELSPVALRVALHRLRSRYRELLLGAVRDTLGPEEGEGAELDALLAALEPGKKGAESR